MSDDRFADILLISLGIVMVVLTAVMPVVSFHRDVGILNDMFNVPESIEWFKDMGRARDYSMPKMTATKDGWTLEKENQRVDE